MAKKQYYHPKCETLGEKDAIAGWYMSEKLDGRRAIWDGGVSRGKPKAEIPWANCGKDSRFKDTQVATGLWSSNGNVIHAPDDWLDVLPDFPIDGELWIGRGKDLQQIVMSVTSAIVPGFGWSKVRFMPFDLPTHAQLFVDRKIDTPTCKMTIDYNACKAYIGLRWISGHRLFIDAVAKLRALGMDALGFEELPGNEDAARRTFYERHETWVAGGAEGSVVRSPYDSWDCSRSRKRLKCKPFSDEEGTVVDWVPGRGRLTGMMGALVVTTPRGGRLELSGFTDHQRRLAADGWPAEFQKGDIVTYKYRELTASGSVTEGRFWRKRSD